MFLYILLVRRFVFLWIEVKGALPGVCLEREGELTISAPNEPGKQQGMWKTCVAAASQALEPFSCASAAMEAGSAVRLGYAAATKMMLPPAARKAGIKSVRFAVRVVLTLAGMGKLPSGDMNSFWTSMMTSAELAMSVKAEAVVYLAVFPGG